MKQEEKWRLCCCCFLLEKNVWAKKRKEKKKTRMVTTHERARALSLVLSFVLSFYPSLSFSLSFIRSKLLADEMIICFCMRNNRFDREEKDKKGCDARTGARTLDIVVKSHTLYRLSYPGHMNTRTSESDHHVFGWRQFGIRLIGHLIPSMTNSSQKKTQSLLIGLLLFLSLMERSLK